MNSGISVIIPTYNREAYLDRAIRSALAQCRSADEIIVVDDGSTDRTKDVADRFGDSIRYHYISNGGAGRARNIGLDLATKDYVAFLDSDDEWFDHKLDLQRSLLDARPELLYVFSDFAITHADGCEVHNFINHWQEQPQSWEKAIGPPRQYSEITNLPQGVDDFDVFIGDTSAAQIIDPIILTSSLMVRRREAGDALRFAEDLSILEDLYCFARLSLRGHGAYLDRETTWQHGAADSRISSAGKYDRALAWIKINERVWQNTPAFRTQHAEIYEKVVKRNDIRLARCLLAEGRPREARHIFANNPYTTIRDRLLSRLPTAMMCLAAFVRRRLLCR